MKSSAKIFYGLTVFMGIMAVIYILATRNVSDTGSVQGLEWAGAIGLALAAGLTLMLGAYFHFTERRIDILPQDWEEAEIEDGAGMLGFFSPGSIWPFVMCVGIGIMGYAIAFMAYWLLLLGAVILIWSGIMLNLQYIMPKEKH